MIRRKSVTLSKAKGLPFARFLAESTLNHGRFFVEFILSEAKGSE